MSEEFDKEAEKEKLRQQLAEEEAKREATQHMSELLLKGATMTNHHCDECSDPLFRHEGQEFCPSCGRQRPAEEQEGTGTPAASGSVAQSQEQPSSPEATQGQSEPRAEAGERSMSGGRRATGGQEQAGRSAAAGSADLPAARAALARKVTVLAQEAEATTDVGRARELLAAVREGAEAISALDGTS